MTPGRKKATAAAAGRSGEISVYQLKVTLRGIKPPIWRRIQVPGHIKLGVFHEILQEVMGWTNTHLHQFVIQGRYFAAPDEEFDSPETQDENKLTLAEAIHLAGIRFSDDYVQPGEPMAAAGTAEEDRELVADEFAATVGEDGRTTGKACAVLLAAASGGASEPTAVRGDVAAHRDAASARRIAEPVAVENSAHNR